MSRFVRSHEPLAGFANDVVWHVTGFAQTMLDLITLAALGLALYATWTDDDAWQRAASAHQASIVTPARPVPTGRCDATNDTCITAMVLQPLES
jgi:hypothetical protein